MRTALLVLASSFSTLAACTATDPIAVRLEQCGLIGEGTVGSQFDGAFYAPNECYRACLGGAGCEELEAALCRSSLELLIRCDQRCAHRCADGALIAVEAVCDGVETCEGGEDEMGCPTFTCRDGTVLPARARCDGSSSCSDGEDEIGCPGVFRCESTWGEPLAGRWYECSGYVECADGSDERDCPEHVCEDGTRIAHRQDEAPRCDGRWHCRDGSDERDCAQLVLMCSTP